MRHTPILLSTFLLMAAYVPAMADPVSAESCAKTLSPAALQIYRAAAPDVKPNSNMQRLLRGKVMPMVMSGDMTVKIARPAAMQASFCLRDLQLQPGVQVVANTTPGFRQPQ